jgi:Lipocalin-like domain
MNTQRRITQMRCALGFIIGLMLPIAAFAQVGTPIAGRWSLVSLNEDHHGQITHPLGDKPQGQVIYGDHGELVVILLSGEREKKAGTPLTPVGPALAYYGTYTVSGNNIAYHVTASTYPNFAGTDQKGTFTVKGDTLTLVREITGVAEPFTSTLELVRAR